MSTCKYSKWTHGQEEALKNILGGDGVCRKILARKVRVTIEEIGEPCLRLISRKDKIILAPTDGTKTLARAGDIFTGYVDDCFLSWGTDVPGKATVQTAVSVYKKIKDGTVSQMFNSFGNKLDYLCLTQHQIIQFVVDHRNWPMNNVFATFFLFKVKNEFLVADLRWPHKDEPGVMVSRFSADFVWNDTHHIRLVVPQQL